MTCLECPSVVKLGRRKYCSESCSRKARDARYRGSEFTSRGITSEPECELPYDEHERLLRDLYDEAASSVLFLSPEVRWCIEDDVRRFAAMHRANRS